MNHLIGTYWSWMSEIQVQKYEILFQIPAVIEDGTIKPCALYLNHVLFFRDLFNIISYVYCVIFISIILFGFRHCRQLHSLDWILQPQLPSNMQNVKFQDFPINRGIGVPKQRNGYDCGVYVINYMDNPEFISKKSSTLVRLCQTCLMVELKILLTS